ncbi:VOC family protein [Bacillus sp. 165]|uniref:VOC family protein n=1 Tax=Bacillus sp. 165 TaxID=1529117 RepID=UPI001ADC6643|nr:VOC family protein [Bacillus sp. 165]MBO9130421.1 VOC family protein [Bacillus sp. 165]
MNFHAEPITFTGPIHLLVTDLNRSLAFYQEIIGLQLLTSTDNKIVLTADGKTPLLIVEQPQGVLPKEKRTTGLYHFALLLPSRIDLSVALRHLLETGYPLQGASDHLVSEAIYLADPDGNGIEIYADRSNETWQWENGAVLMSTGPINAENLLAEGKDKSWNGMPEGTVMGHIHLHVSDLQKAEEFYCKGLGLDVVSRYGSQALFLSNGGYHHHIGLNTWNGIGAPQPARNTVGLKSLSLVFPNEDERKKVMQQLQQIPASVIEKNGALFTKDPSGNYIELCVSK